jgi:single-strand DNA-binding protein
MRATSVGPDLSRSIVRIIEKTGSGRDAGVSADEPVVEAESDEKTSDGEEAIEDDSAVGGKALPLSA